MTLAPLLRDRGIGRWSASEGALKATQSRRHRSVVEDLRARHAMRRRGRYGTINAVSLFRRCRQGWHCNPTNQVVGSSAIEAPHQHVGF